ncbi:Hypothetical predicted protein [Cloeon dipterum]|uniref:Uncharacterized protein n=1 Tax=Cloeon dipterum TaxID=197152 RepID=A0A8S1D9B5_9INSE|nr:Hypothetical predicted protein [Cloeon dipterum]
MFYQFNNFTGTISPATHTMWPYYPLSPRPYSKADSSEFIFDQKSTRAAQVKGTTRVVQRKCVPGSNNFYSPLDERVRQKMELFQKPNGIPIHLKGGQADKVLFGVTLGLSAVGFILVARLIYSMAVPKKQ